MKFGFSNQKLLIVPTNTILAQKTLIQNSRFSKLMGTKVALQEQIK